MGIPKADSAAARYIRMMRLATRTGQAALRAERRGRDVQRLILSQRAAKLALFAIERLHS